MNDTLSLRNAVMQRLVKLVFLILTTATVAQADHNQMLQRVYRGGISRHVACDSQGFCYLLVPSPRSVTTRAFELKFSRKPHPESIPDFSATVALPVLKEGADTPLFSAGITVDSHDRLHLTWTTEDGLTAYSVVETASLRSGKGKPKWLNPATGQDGVLVVATARSWAGDICRAPDGRVWLAWSVDGADSHVTMHLGTARDGKWQPFEVGGGKKLYPPSLLVTRDGTFHLVTSDMIGLAYHSTGKVSELASKKDWKVERSHSGLRPALAEINGRVLAVHESGDSLKYTFLEGEKKPKQSFPLTDLDSRLVWDTVHSPRLVVDQHGVAWMFFIDSTRQHVFYSRWLGTRWSPILNSFWLTRNTARFEDSHLSIDWLGVGHGLGADKSSIGLAIGHNSLHPDTKFHALRVPSLKADAGTKVLFLDLKEIQHLDGLDLSVNTAQKHPDPVITAGRRSDFDSQGAGKLAVIKQNGVYRAWYTGMYREPGSEWPKSGMYPQVRVGYAESSDGIHFKKKPLGLKPFGNNNDTNIVAGLPATAIFRPIVPTGMHIDSADPDPSRRYKFLTWSGSRPARKLANPDGVEEQTWTLWTSPDGVGWKQTSRGGIRYPGGLPSSFSPQSLFHDADEPNPAKKYKAYGFLGLNNDRRGAGYGYSADAVEWTADPRNPVFDAWARATPVVRNGKVHQIHDAVVWKYRQYYLALYQYQTNGEEMTIELAMSRDGENFSYIQPGSEIVRRGAAEQWDCDAIAPSVPLMDEHDIKVYYTGYRFSKTKLIEGEHSCGLATLRLDGFTHLTLEDSRDVGSVTTIPIDRGDAAELQVNASCADGSRIEVELINPESGQTLPGFSREECVPITTDSLAHQVVWTKRSLADVRNAKFQLRFHLTQGRDSPKLYSFEFRRASDKNPQ